MPGNVPALLSLGIGLAPVLSAVPGNWNSVEEFFDSVRPYIRSHEYQSFIEKSHKRFHPDRWRSRGVLKSVVDEAERSCLEVGKLIFILTYVVSDDFQAANTVAQALTPLWRDVRG